MTTPQDQDPDTNPTNPSYSQAETQADDQASEYSQLPSTIGHYRIESLIGQGGMGAVYKAEQDSPRRTVALKVIKAGVASKSLLLRFEIEAQILGKLDHPGIATIYEAGTFDEGQGQQPFFAMEFVQGQELLDYADSKKLGTRDRLALLAKIADAVQHAHQKGIIHRDLKPGNILVNNDGQVKVLDFGVARATDADIQTATMQTDIGQLIGTIPYMSPEQASGNPDDLDTRSDVYALGVIAYELLTGQMPYDLKQKMIHEAVRVIREDEPKTLSTINKTFRGDVEIIVSKALIKEKDRRYQSASDLGSDIERYLSNEPIEARPPSTWYQLSKFSRRNRALVAGIIAVLIVSVAGALISINFAMGEAEQKQLALNAADEARIAKEAAESAQAEEAKRADELQQVADFQSEQLGQIEVERMGIQLRDSIIEGAPEDARGVLVESLASVNFTNIALGTLEANIFTRTIEAIDSKFVDQPLVQAQLFQSVADTLRELGILDMALNPQQQALSIRRSQLGAADINTIISIGNLGNLYLAQGKPELAKPLFQEALDLRRDIFGSGHPETLNALNNVASLLKASGNLQQAKPLFIEALGISRQVHGKDHPTTFTLTNNLGNLLESDGQLEEAEQYYREGLDMSRKLYGDDHPFTLTSIGNMAALLQVQNKLGDAESFQLEALETTRRILGDQHPSTIIAMNNTGALFEAQGKLQEAEPYYQEAIDTCRNTLGDTHPFTPVLIRNMGLLLKSQGKINQAVPYYQQVFDIKKQMHGDEHSESVQSMYELAVLFELGKHWTKAEPLWRQQLKVARNTTSDDDTRLGALLTRLGNNLFKQERHSDAQLVLKESLKIRKQVMPVGHWLIWNTQSLLGETLTKQSKFIEAEPLLIEAAEQIQPPEAAAFRRQEAIQRVVDLYTALHAAQPNGGYDLKAQQWQQQIESQLPSE